MSRSLLLCTLMPVALWAQMEATSPEIEYTRVKTGPVQRATDANGLSFALQVTNNNAAPLRLLGKGLNGLRLQVGAPIPGGAFGFGPAYVRPDLANGKAYFRAGSLSTWRRYEVLDLQFALPKLADDHAFLDFYGAYRNFPWMDYYGPGGNSSRNGRTTFRLETTNFDFTAGVKPASFLRFGVTGGYLKVNTGAGTHPGILPIQKSYVPALAPGVTAQSDFLRGGAFLQLDWRDNPEGPRKGGNFVAHVSQYDDRTLGLHDFRRLTMEVQQYLPLFNERRVIAVRGKTVLTDRRHDQTVPFYLQPTLGGPDDLRGFRPFRFYDNNLMVWNAEWRWEVFSGLDMALFADAGKVFHKTRDWNFHHFEADYGFGLRFNVRNDVFLRTDVAFSHEGFQIWFRFMNPW